MDSKDQKAADRKTDVIAIMIIFTCLIMAAVHFASGWTF